MMRTLCARTFGGAQRAHSVLAVQKRSFISAMKNGIV
jgi:hypothetical protein